MAGGKVQTTDRWNSADEIIYVMGLICIIYSDSLVYVLC